MNGLPTFTRSLRDQMRCPKTSPHLAEKFRGKKLTPRRSPYIANAALRTESNFKDNGERRGVNPPVRNPVAERLVAA